MARGRGGIGQGLAQGAAQGMNDILQALMFNKQMALRQQQFEQQNEQFNKAQNLRQQMVDIYRERNRLKDVASPKFSDDLFDFLPDQRATSKSPAQSLIDTRPPLFEPRKFQVNAQYLRPIPRLMEDFRRGGNAQDLMPTPNSLGLEGE